MPRQNRVTPTGDLIATTARGAWMGNRGCLHDDRGRIRRLYQTKRWIMCRLDFKERRRQVMAPGRYTELFFLDEVTALAAGHRPCAECLRSRYDQFRTMWGETNSDLIDTAKISANQLDTVLHTERLIPNRQKASYASQLGRLPSGTFVTLGHSQTPHLIWDKELYPWHPTGYGASYHADEQIVQVLTPPSIVRMFVEGYRPHLHHSMTALNA